MTDEAKAETLEHMLACAERAKLMEPLFEHAMAMCRLPSATIEDYKWLGDLHSMALGKIPMLDFRKDELGIHWTVQSPESTQS